MATRPLGCVASDPLVSEHSDDIDFDAF